MRVVIVLIFLFCSAAGFAQRNFKPGYMLPLQGDSVKGFIDYRAWAKNPDRITFRTAPDGSDAEFTALQIKEFGTSGTIYRSAIITLDDVDFQNKNIRLTDGSFAHHEDTTFLKILVGGAKSLGVYQSEKGIKSFYISRGNTFELLNHRTYVEDRTAADPNAQTTGTQRVLAESNGYKGQLYEYLGDCPALRPKFKLLKYDESGLERIFTSYYDCTHTRTAFTQKKEKVKVQYGAMLGFSSSKLTFQGSDTYEYLKESDFSGLSPIIPGVFLNLVAPGNLNKLSWVNEIMLFKYTTGGTYRQQDPNSSVIHTDHNTKIGQSAFRLNSQIRYAFPLSANTGIFVNAGVSVGYAFSSLNYDRSVKIYPGQEIVTEGEAIPQVSKQPVGYMGGIGLAIGKFGIEGRYIRSDGPSNNNVLASTYTSACVFLSYRLH